MKGLLTIIACFGAVASATAQTAMKANYKLAQKFEKDVRDFDNDLSVAPQFINGTDKFWYRYKTSEGCKFFIVDPDKKDQRLLFDNNDVIGQISKITLKAHDAKEFKPGTLTFDASGQNFKFYYEGSNYSYNIKSKKITLAPKDVDKDLKPSGHTFSPDSCYILYSSKNNLYVYGNKDKGIDTTVVQLTFDGERDYSYSKYPIESEKQHTTPEGRWLKNSKMFWVMVKDNRKLGDMYLINMINEQRPALTTYKYCLPGDTAVTQYAFKLIDIPNKKVIDVKADKWKDQSLSFSYDNNKGDKVFFQRMKRTSDERDLCMYDVESGEIKVVINEVCKPFFDYQIDQTHFLNDGKEILLRSEESGYGHFYLYDTKTGKRKNAVTEGNYVTGQMLKFDSTKREVYFYGFGREKGIDPYYYILYRASLDKRGVDVLTPGNANHRTIISPTNRFMIDNYSRVDMEPKSVLRNRDGKVILELASPDLKRLYETGWIKPERFSVKADDGVTDLYGVMWKPIGFDSTKKYPIISEVYPGPHFEYVPTSFCLKDSHASAIAQLGFIVIQVGHRGGSPIRGKAYQRYAFEKMRDYPLADDKAAITQLADRYNFIDISKVGIFGHSGGGFMSVAALCTYNDFYTAAVAAAGNHDNRIYNTGWVEIHNGVKETVTKSKDGRDSTVTFKSNPIQTNMELAKRYKGHLLLVHGLMDDNVNPASTVRMAKALIEEGKNFEMVLLPKSKHSFVEGEDKFFVNKMWRHFAKYLLGDTSADFNSEMDTYK